MKGIEQIERDIATFIDPGTELVTSLRDKIALLKWQAYGLDDETTLRTQGESIEALYRGRWIPYPDLLAELGDLGVLARSIARTIGRDDDAPYVEAQAVTTDGRQPAVDLVDLSSEPQADGTRVVFITGDAGAGKSRMLAELTRKAAVSYLEGNKTYLYLNVNAQGRGLARLNEALATELQDLRARLTYHSVARLVRVGKLRLIVDGFDELIGGQGSYEEAFGSLAGFIEELNGSGAVIAAARSVYYEQEFLARANTSSELGALTWQLVPVEMASWTDRQRNDYIDQLAARRGLSQEATGKLREDVLESLQATHQTEYDILSKPLFIAATCDLILDNELQSGSSLLERLVAGYVKREVTRKLIGNAGPMLDAAQYDQLLREIAIEMWRQRSRELNRTTLREIVGIFAQVNGLTQSVEENLVDAASSRALLKKGSKPNTVSFEHDLFFSHYLGGHLAEMLTRGTREIRNMFRRANLPIEAARSAVRRISISRDDAESMLDLIAEVAAPSEGNHFVEQNSGVLVAEVLRSVAAENGARLRVSGFTFGDADMANIQIQGTDFISNNFIQTDLRGSKLEDCTLEGGYCLNVLIDNDTRLDLHHVEPSVFHGLRLASATGIEQVYNPARVVDLLRNSGVESAGLHPDEINIDTDLLSTMDKMVRYFSRHNLLRDKHQASPDFTREPSWDQILGAATNAGLLRQESRSAAGTTNVFYRRLFRPEDLMAGMDRKSRVTPKIRAFWEEVSR